MTFNDPTELLALNGFQEANLEPLDGLAAVMLVTLNRRTLKYQSDGTLKGTVEHPLAFSWTQCTMEDEAVPAHGLISAHHEEVYVKVAHTPEEIEARVAALLIQSQKYVTAWARAMTTAQQMMNGTYHHVTPAYGLLTPDTVLYLNHAIAHAPWATADKRVCDIGHHTFYRN